MADYTDDETIKGRLKKGKEFIERGIKTRDETASMRFLDGSELASQMWYESDEDIPTSQEVGNVNYLAINILTKMASIAIADPDWYVTCEEEPAPPPPPVDPLTGQPLLQLEPEQQLSNSEIVRQSLRELWKKRRWARITRKALLKRCISGMGCIAYSWDAETGPRLEHVKMKDLAVDPYLTDWRELDWAARCIRMPRYKAAARWPEHEVDFGSDNDDIPDLDADKPHSVGTVEVWIYWDATTETIYHGTETILEQGPNTYDGRVPLIFLEGDAAPDSEFFLGDYDTSIGIQQMLSRLQAMINDSAENEGSILWFNSSLLKDASKEAFLNGRPSTPVDIEGDVEDAFGFRDGAQMSSTVLEAFRLAFSGLDSATGVTEYMRGVIQTDPKFATQVGYLQGQSGRRGEQARIEYELFMDDCAQAVAFLIQKFGLSLIDEESETDVMLHDAFMGVQDICVLENSTSYKDTNVQLQLWMQLIQMLTPFMQAGLLDPAPFIVKVLNAAGERNTTPYFAPQVTPTMLPQPTPPNQGGNEANGEGKPSPTASKNGNGRVPTAAGY